MKNDLEKLYDELRVMEEESRSGMAPIETPEPEKPKPSAWLDNINAFFIDEKLTDDISYQCFLESNKLTEHESKAMHYKYAQKRFSMKQRGTWNEPWPMKDRK